MAKTCERRKHTLNGSLPDKLLHVYYLYVKFLEVDVTGYTRLMYIDDINMMLKELSVKHVCPPLCFEKTPHTSIK